MSGGSVGVKIDDDMGEFFQTRKGLRQGDPLCPVLFNVVADMLAVLVARAIGSEQIQGVVPHLVDEGLSILQYADDTILFIEDDIEQAKNLKLLLCVFGKRSGLKINFHKSELFCLGAARTRASVFMQILVVGKEPFPFKYLGIPMSQNRIDNKHWGHIEERIQKKLSSWKGKLLSSVGRLVLIN